MKYLKRILNALLLLPLLCHAQIYNQLDLSKPYTWTAGQLFTQYVAAGNPKDTMIVNGITLAPQFVADSNVTAIFEAHTHAAGNAPQNGPIYYGARTDGTYASPTIVSNGDYLVTLGGVGFDGTDLDAGALISAIVDGTPGAGSMPTSLAFFTTPDGSNTPAEIFRMSSFGGLSVAGDYGTANYSLLSGGAGAAPSWSLVPLAGQANLPSNTIEGNSLSTSAAPQALLPLDIVQMTSVVMNAEVATYQAEAGIAVTWSGIVSSGSSSATLSSSWTAPTGAYWVTFNNSDFDARLVTFTNGMTSATWSGNTTANTSATGNYALGGVKSLIDKFAPHAGQTILVTGISSAGPGGTVDGINNGLWILQAGPWTRPINFSYGYVLAQYCNISVFIQRGTLYGGSTWILENTSSGLTIGTNTTQWKQSYSYGSYGAPGLVRTTEVAGSSYLVLAYSQSLAPARGDCISVSSFGGVNAFAFGDVGNAASMTNGVSGSYVAQGPCVISDAVGHILSANANNAPTSNYGTVACAAADNVGCITGIAAATTSVTLTFGDTFAMGYIPSCVASSNAAVPFAISTTSASNSSATFTFPALASTTQINYLCL